MQSGRCATRGTAGRGRRRVAFLCPPFTGLHSRDPGMASAGNGAGIGVGMIRIARSTVGEIGRFDRRGGRVCVLGRVGMCSVQHAGGRHGQAQHHCHRARQHGSAQKAAAAIVVGVHRIPSTVDVTKTEAGPSDPAPALSTLQVWTESLTPVKQPFQRHGGPRCSAVGLVLFGRRPVVGLALGVPAPAVERVVDDDALGQHLDVVGAAGR